MKQASLGEVQTAEKGGDVTELQAEYCSLTPVAQQILVTRPEYAMSPAAERQAGGSARVKEPPSSRVAGA